MQNEQILKKAIERAVENGWEKGKDFLESYFGIDRIYDTKMLQSNTKNRTYYRIIFSHKFAKAFWKQHNCNKEHPNTDVYCNPDIWQYHLQQMVLEEEPLKYLTKF